MLLAATPALANCVTPTANEGAIVYNSSYNVHQVCAGNTWVALGQLNPSAGAGACSTPTGNEGAIIYNDDFDVLQYCDGTNWMAMHGSGLNACRAPALCPNIGDICDDSNAGTTNDPIFAGHIVRGATCYNLYVTDDNQSAAAAWKTTTGADDIATDSDIDGAANQSQVVPPADGTFPAFDLCYNLNDGGFTDWYLPSRIEVRILKTHQAAIDTNAQNPFIAQGYQTSTELGPNEHAYQHFNANGSNLNTTKTVTFDVRCVRSQVSVGGAISGLCIPPSDCQNPGDECLDGTVYAGCSPDGFVPMFTTHCDQGETWGGGPCSGVAYSSAWNNGNAAGFVDTTLVDGHQFDGESSTATLAAEDSDNVTGGFQPHIAAKECADLNTLGHDDWYLPAFAEAVMMRRHQVAIGGFESGKYWTSSEWSTTQSHVLEWGDGDPAKTGKETLRFIRCIRR